MGICLKDLFLRESDPYVYCVFIVHVGDTYNFTSQSHSMHASQWCNIFNEFTPVYYDDNQSCWFFELDVYA